MFKETKVLHIMVVKISKETSGVCMYLKNSGVRKYGEFPYWASLVAQMVKNPPAMQETWVRSLGGKILWRREWQPTPVFLPGELHGQRNLVGYSLWGHKESDMTERLYVSAGISQLSFWNIYCKAR